MATITSTRANWGNVTLAEYAAIELVGRDDALELVHGYWDYVHTLDNPFKGPDANRLTPAGVEWLARMHDAVLSPNDTECQAAAREIVHGLGLLTVLNAVRIARGELPN
jgi:hypothetical protein